MKKQLSDMLIRIKNFIWSLFINGLITVAPLLLTIAVFDLLFKIIKSLLKPVRNLILSSSSIIPPWLEWIPQIEVILVIASILFLGTMLNIFILRSIIARIEEWIAKIPLIRPIYSGMKKLVQSFGPHNTNGIQQVVLVQLTEGVRTIGFVTGYVPKELTPQTDVIYASVYVPTTPNPTGGFFLMIAHDQLIPLDISRQEAMALIMSVGMILPSPKKQAQS